MSARPEPPDSSRPSPDPNRRPRIILATSRDWLAASVEGVLDRDRFEVTRVPDGESMAAAVDEAVPDGVILDQDLAGEETPTLCRGLVEGALGERIPLVVYSSDLRDEELQARIVEAGAWAVIQEPIRSRYLVATLRRYLEIGRAARGRPDTGARGRRANGDLPGLEGVLERLPLLEALAERHETSVALVAVGPRQPGSGELLERQRRRTAELCLEVLRSADLCGWLDDEGDVVIAAYGTSREGARQLAERLAARAAERSQVERPEDALSVGIVEVRPGEDVKEVRAGEPANGETELVRAAQEALRRARAAGGGIEFGSRR